MLLSNKVPLDRDLLGHRCTGAAGSCGSSALAHTHVGKGGGAGRAWPEGRKDPVSPSGFEGLSH